MPGSTDNTEGNASAVPSVASGESQPLTRREARAQREAAAKGKKRGFMKNRAARETPEPATGIQEPVTTEPANPVAAPMATPAPAPAVEQVAGTDGVLPTPQPGAGANPAAEASPGKDAAATADTGQAKERAKAAFKADTSKSVAAPGPVAAQQAGPAEEPAEPVESAEPGKAKILAAPAAQGGMPAKGEATKPEAESAAQNPAPAEGKVPAPPVSDSTDLAETGQPDAAEADIPAELLIGTPEPKKSRAGRNLPAAIGVGLLMLGVVLVGLMWSQPLLVIALIALSGIGCWEVARATTHAKTAVPQLPLYLSSVLLPVSAIWGGVEALGFSYIACILIALLFRLMEGLKGAVASVMSSVFIISWVPLLLSFALLILDSENGQWLIATLLLLAVANDTFGYIVGVLIGKHPMAPKISPKKSWEGFAGSMIGSMAIGACAMHFWLEMPWWTGVILAFFTTIAATTGDFAESMVKRELGIKDMSNLLPGHGGIMDRLDSILFVIPLGYVISHVLAWSVEVF
ncbi:MAG: phosphatidate cytidylyltransferase [Glutamicibacter sp.]|uniref:phosphatidate cytidylyltransferase n=1 Tax=Glutamicibacter sp. TaxID=1931995 RepID=UPI002FC927C3